MKSIRVKNWAKYQHFKDRKPIWIKLYRDILNDLEWHELDGDSAKALVMLWLIAAEDEGQLPDIKKIAFRLRMTEQKAKSILDKLLHWIEIDDIKLISDVYQDDIKSVSEPYQVDAPEKRREEKNREDEIGRAKRTYPALPESHGDAFIFGKSIGMTQDESDNCFDYYAGNGWKVGKNPMRDWHAVWRRWHRTNKAASEPITQTAPDCDDGPMSDEYWDEVERAKAEMGVKS